MDSTKQTEKPNPGRELTPQARRALAEAEERRRLADAQRQFRRDCHIGAAADPFRAEVFVSHGPLKRPVKVVIQ